MKKFKKSMRFATCVGAAVSAAMLVAGMTPAAAFAETADEATSDLLQEVAANMGDDTTYAYDYLDGQDTSSLMATDFPAKFDLRDRGVVTPVKFQNPWGSCWAFGIISAAEISILSELNTTYEETGLDLSEHHLSWFAKNHLPVEGEEGYDGNSQAGEGIWYPNNDNSQSMSSGCPYLGTFTFASGMGVTTEESFPYQGLNKWVEVKVKHEGSKPTVVDLTTDYKGALALGYTNAQIRCWSKVDDWSIPEKAEDGTSNRFQQLYALEESNILPSPQAYYDANAKTYVLNEVGVNAIKAELAAGRGVNIAFMADNSSPSDATNITTSRYINKDANGNWAHFAYSLDTNSLSANHSVTIVGYDDTYAASNFTHNVYVLDENGDVKKDSQGNPILDEQSTKATTPVGNGAWIVKNSWGSSEEEFPNSNCGDGWGTNGTGYFYLSYYDMSLNSAETFDFAVTEEEKSDYDYSLCYEYDFMPTSSAKSTTSFNAVSMANVFEADQVCEVNNLSCETGAPGTQVKLEMYLIDDDAQNPTDGTLVATKNATFTYGGYHRVTLDNPVRLKAGQKFAVVVTETLEIGSGTTYALNFHASGNESSSDASEDGFWAKGVVNNGESFLCVTGDDGTKWTDWADFIALLKAVNPSDAASKDYDNFCIKAYANPVDETVYRLYNATTSEHLWTTDANEYAVLKDYGWTQEGVAWTSPATGTGVYRLYNPALGTHHYTSDEHEVSVLKSEYGWVLDNGGDPMFFSADATDEDAISVYRMYNDGISQHLLTTDSNEYAVLPSFDWTQEGIAFYAYAAE